MKLTNEQLTEIEQKTESLSVDMPFYTWEASQLLNNDIPALLEMIAELQWYVIEQGKRLDRAEELLLEAQDGMVASYSSEAWSNINRFLYGEEDE